MTGATRFCEGRSLLVIAATSRRQLHPDQQVRMSPASPPERFGRHYMLQPSLALQSAALGPSARFPTANGVRFQHGVTGLYR